MRFFVTTSLGFGGSLKDLERVLSALEKRNLEFLVDKDVARHLGRDGVDIHDADVDMILSIGGDGTLLETLIKMRDRQIPILGIKGSGNLGFLTEVSILNFDIALDKLLNGEWWIERRTRLDAVANNESCPPALNEVAIFAKRSATMIRYSLRINDELIWRDGADGVLVATPTGSTAYAMSAGGPVVAYDARVFVIVPVNSINQARRPFVIPDSVVITVEDIESPVSCEVIIDGRYRVPIEDNFVQIRKSKHDALFVRLTKKKFSFLSERLGKKAQIYEDIENIPPSSKFILKILEYEGPLTQKQIVEKTMLPPRTVRYALNILLEKGLIVKKASLRDTRQYVYSLAF